MAEQSRDETDKRGWLELAEQWLHLVRQRARSGSTAMGGSPPMNASKAHRPGRTFPLARSPPPVRNAAWRIVSLGVV